MSHKRPRPPCLKTTMPRPGKLDWNAVREDQYRDIPFLRNLRGELAGY